MADEPPEIELSDSRDQPMTAAFTKHLHRKLFAWEEGGFYKAGPVITSPQSANFTVANMPEMLTGPGLGIQLDVHAVAEVEAQFRKHNAA